jgi:putative metallohydrolase (TIGR04338 family)
MKGSAMTTRDNQRQRLYDAENVLHGRRVSAAAKKHLIDTEASRLWVERDPETGQQRPARYPSVAATQAYVDAVTSARWFRARWGNRAITVRANSGSNAMMGGNLINLAGDHRRSEAVILHEMAHALSPYSGVAPHGKEFAGILLTLVRQVMGREQSDELRAAFRTHKVRVSMAAVPSPTRPVETRAQRAAKARAKDNLGDRLGLSTDSQRKVAASVIRVQVRAGLFGQPGCKPRTHALATARLLEQGTR